MSNEMPTPDTALKEFFDNNEVFASLFNDTIFAGKQIVNPSNLLDCNSSYTASLNGKNVTQKIIRYRDVIRQGEIKQDEVTNEMKFVILCVENQNKIHYAMPLRVLLYDALEYNKQLTSSIRLEEQTNWTVDERLSRIKKGDKIKPILTIVFYTGETKWDGPTSLHDMLDIPDVIKPMIPNYEIPIIDIGHNSDLHFTSSYLHQLQISLTSIYNQKEDDETKISNYVLSLAAILANDVKLYRNASKTEGRNVTMCEALKKRDEKLNAQIKEKDTQIKEKDAQIKEKDVQIKELDAQIEVLKKQIAELQK